MISGYPDQDNKVVKFEAVFSKMLYRQHYIVCIDMLLLQTDSICACVLQITMATDSACYHQARHKRLSDSRRCASSAAVCSNTG